MVFFTCNHCGESLKKPMVDKHYTYNKCRNAPFFLTCVDCLKDFSGEEFREHTKCISESEKYSAKGFVAKPDRNKGAQKQEAWTEIIQMHLAHRSDLDDYTRSSLERIAQQTNVPRKKAKFVNFLGNCMRMSPNNAQKMWSVVEKALEEFQAKERLARDEHAARQRAAKEEREAAKAATELTVNGVDEKTTDIVGEKPSKKNKKAKQVSEITSTTDEIAATVESTDKKQKKSKKRKAETSAEFETEVGAISSKSKKKRHDQEVAVETPPSNFEWKRVITEVLQKKGCVKLTKLKAKVLKKLTAFNEEVLPTVKDEKKYEKHFEQMSKFIQIEGDTAKLIVSQ